MVRDTARIMSPWFEHRLPGHIKFSTASSGFDSTSVYIVTVTDDNTDLYACVHQPDKTTLGAASYIDIGVTLLQQTTAASDSFAPAFAAVASSGNTVERQNQLEALALPAGTYYLVTTSTGAKMDQVRAAAVLRGAELLPQDLERPVTVSVHSSAAVTVEPTAFDSSILTVSLY